MELEDVDGDGRVWEQSNSWQKTRESSIFSLKDRDDEISEDPIPSKDKKEGGYEFETDSYTSDWLASLFEEVGGKCDGVMSLSKSDIEVTTKFPTEVNINSPHKL